MTVRPVADLPGEMSGELLDAIAVAAGAGRLGIVATTSGAPPKIVYANTGAAELLGYRLEELLETPIGALLTREAAEQVRGAAPATSGPGPGKRFETRGRRKDGTEFAAEVTTLRVNI